MKKTLNIALPNKGALSEEASSLVKASGYNCRKQEKDLMACDAENGVDFYFLRPRDIAVYIERGVIDIGVTGRDLTLETGARVEEIMALGIGKSAFRYAVPKDSDLKPEDFGGKRIATSYPGLVRKDLVKRGLTADIIELDGAVEISVRLGVADVVADVVESGRTLQQAGLKVVGEPVLMSEAIIIAGSKSIKNSPQVKVFLDRVKGIVVARDYVMVEYDLLRSKLETACKITPGIESPTLAPLSDPAWVAVKAMIKRNKMNSIIDDLSALGAKGIIITDIKTCRI